jgi:hypothetical protein
MATQNDVWAIRNVSKKVREIAKIEAKKSGKSTGVWITDLIQKKFISEEEEESRIALHKKFSTLETGLKELINNQFWEVQIQLDKIEKAQKSYDEKLAKIKSKKGFFG